MAGLKKKKGNQEPPPSGAFPPRDRIYNACLEKQAVMPGQGAVLY